MNTTLERAIAFATKNYSDRSLSHRCAFANCIQFLVDGIVGGFGGPSLRQYLVDRKSYQGDLPAHGQWSFEQACEFAAPLCFEPAENFKDDLLDILENEYTFDNDPDDLAILQARVVAAAPTGYKLDPSSPLNPRLIDLIRSELSQDFGVVPDKICQARLSVDCLCGVVLSHQNRSGYCFAHRNQNPEHKKRVTQSARRRRKKELLKRQLLGQIRTTDEGKTAKKLYDDGYRLYSSLTDTDEEISLAKDGKGIGYWADGTNRDTSSIFRILKLENNHSNDQVLRILSALSDEDEDEDE